MNAKQQPNPEQDRRAAALRENLRKRKEQARLREPDAVRIAQSVRDDSQTQAKRREDQKKEKE